MHGYAFLAYVLVVFLVRAEYGWSNRMTLLALASSVPPLATVPFERWAFHQRFDAHAHASATLGRLPPFGGLGRAARRR